MYHDTMSLCKYLTRYMYNVYTAVSVLVSSLVFFTLLSKRISQRPAQEQGVALPTVEATPLHLETAAQEDGSDK